MAPTIIVNKNSGGIPYALRAELSRVTRGTIRFREAKLVGVSLIFQRAKWIVYSEPNAFELADRVASCRSRFPNVAVVCVLGSAADAEVAQGIAASYLVPAMTFPSWESLATSLLKLSGSGWDGHNFVRPINPSR